MGSGSPTVAVIVPCFNLGHYLPEALDSVAAQTYRDFEVVVVDDGSTEAVTLRTLDECESAGSRVIRGENRGLSAARNIGIRATASPFVTCLDADDRLLPTFLERSVAALEAGADIGFASHWVRTFGDEQGEWRPDRCDLAALVNMNTVNGAAAMRRECFDAVGGFDEEMREGCEDWDFWLSVVEAGFAGTIVPEILYEYRRRPDSMSRLMMEGETHRRLYRRLARKHSTSFRHHLPELLARRESEIAHFRRHLHDLEREHDLLVLTTASCADDVEALKRKAERYRAEQSERSGWDAERSRLEDESRQVGERLTAAQDAFGDARRIALARDADFNRVRREADELRSSKSWRLTAPLRVIFGWLVRALGRR